MVPVDLRLIIGIAEAQGGAAVDLRHRRPHIGKLFDGVGIGRHQRGDAAGRWPALVGHARPDDQLIGAHGADARHHVAARALAHRHHGDDGPDADDDAEQGEDGAQQIAVRARAAPSSPPR